MCGIVAIFSRTGPVIREVIERATLSLKHRGPDGQKVWLSPSGVAALGHARLSIIDLSTGDQPIANEDESLHIVVNGELYGYEAVQKQLVERGHRLRTKSDSEIALHLYEDYGVDCPKHLRGEFAIVLWDEPNRRLFAVRDRFGIKPLFYSLHEGKLYLASEVKALFAAGVPARWSAEAFYNVGGVGGRSSETLFENVFQVPPGHYLLATNDQLEIARYWDFDYPIESESAPARTDSEYVEEFREIFEEAVRLRLRADVPVGCYLSGGIDSCAVLGMAARHHSGPIRAFTLAFDRPEYNEYDIAKQMASTAGAEFTSIPMRQDELAEHFEDAIAQAECLCVNAHGVAKYLLSQAVRKAGYKVVLTGEGSDEILGGYMHFRRDMSPSPKSGSAQAVLAGQHSNNGAGQTLEAIRKALGFVPGWMETSALLSARMHAAFDGDFLNRFAPGDEVNRFFASVDLPGQVVGRHPLHQSLYLWSKSRLANYLLVLLGDRMEMANSIEGRLPFLDHLVVERMRSMPVNQKIRGAAQKFVLRESIRPFVTDAVYRRPKHPFLTPPATAELQGRLSLLMQDTLRGSALASIPFVDRAKVVGILDNLSSIDENARVADDQVLMMLLSASVLQKRYNLAV